MLLDMPNIFIAYVTACTASPAAAAIQTALCIGRQVPKRIYSLEELRLNKIDATQFLSPDDDRIARIRTACQVLQDSTLNCLSHVLSVSCQLQGRMGILRNQYNGHGAAISAIVSLTQFSCRQAYLLC